MRSAQRSSIPIVMLRTLVSEFVFCPEIAQQIDLKECFIPLITIID